MMVCLFASCGRGPAGLVGRLLVFAIVGASFATPCPGQSAGARRSESGTTGRAVPTDEPAAPRTSRATGRRASKAAARNDAAAQPMEHIEQAQAAMKNVKDYTATFSKKELVGKKLIQQTMEMKFREKPFSVYFRYTSEDERGREVIYVDGKYNNELVLHETGLKGLAGTLRFKPSHSMVMAENRHQITDVGISNLLKMAAAQLERDLTDPDLVTKVYPRAKLDDIPCTAIVIKHSRPGQDWPYSDIRLYFDQETRLPIHAERHGWPRREGDKAPLLEEYTYRNLKLNVGLRDIDFDPRNPSYSY